eukprot:2687442-Pyramimonas_sp.AAC.1
MIVSTRLGWAGGESRSVKRLQELHELRAGQFSKCGARLRAAHMKTESLLEMMAPFRNVALALAPRT